MKNKIMSVLTGTALAASLVLLVSSPAQAAGSKAGNSRTGYIDFNASPEPVRKCGKVMLAGEVYNPALDGYWLRGIHGG